MEFRLRAVHTPPPSLPKQGWPPHLENEIAREGVHPARRTCAPRYIIPVRGIVSQVSPRFDPPPNPSSHVPLLAPPPYRSRKMVVALFACPPDVHRCTLARFKPLSGDEFCLWPVPLTGTRGYELDGTGGGERMKVGERSSEEEDVHSFPLSRKS